MVVGCLIWQVVISAEELIAEAKKICSVQTLAGPAAAAAAKALVRNVQYKVVTPELMAYTADQLAQVRMSEESTHGMVAVQKGAKPPWATTPLEFPMV